MKTIATIETRTDDDCKVHYYVRWRDPKGQMRSKEFDTLRDARQFAKLQNHFDDVIKQSQ